MSKSPTGIIPEEYMTRGKLAAVLTFLEKMPVAGDDKESLLVGWAKMVGVRVSASQRARVRNSGVDH
jgi:hypothetical protein